MARYFTRTSSDSIVSNAATVTATPLAISAWVQLNSLNDMVIASVETAGGSGRYQIYYSVSTNEFYAGHNNDAGVGQVASVNIGGTPTLNQWYHVCGIFESITSRFVVVNGIAGTANTVSVTAPAGINRLRIGARTSAGTVGAHWDGRIAEVAVFAGLQVSQAISLSQGVWPFKVAPGSLRNYLPLSLIHI